MIIGRFGATAIWILVALRAGPRTAVGLLDDVRGLDGRVGPGTLFGALARLEHLDLIVAAPPTRDGRAYALGTGLSRAANANDSGGTHA